MPDMINLGPPLSSFLTAFLGYLLGSIPFGLVMTRLAGLGDVRTIGSGNIGATNVLRTGRKELAAATLAGDLLKGTVAVWLGAQFGAGAAIIGGVSAFLGHLYPVWLRFQGGKGVATYIGVLLGLFWPAALLFCAIWLLVAVITRYSSLSALAACLAAPVILAGFGEWQSAVAISVMTIFIFVRHSANIRRLIQGEEGKIGSS